MLKLTNMTNKTVVILMVIAILILLVWVYWSQLRPSWVRKDCHQRIMDMPGEIDVEWDSTLERYDRLYELCLHEKGLK